MDFKNVDFENVFCSVWKKWISRRLKRVRTCFANFANVLSFVALFGVRIPWDPRQNFEKICMRARGLWCRTLARSAVRFWSTVHFGSAGRLHFSVWRVVSGGLLTFHPPGACIFPSGEWCANTRAGSRCPKVV